jgi:hypothetical protein
VEEKITSKKEEEHQRTLKEEPETLNLMLLL